MTFIPPRVVWSELLPESNQTLVNSLPIGNGRIAANCFVDNSTGMPEFGLLLSSQEAWLESGELAKVGWVRLNLSPLREDMLHHVSMELDVATAAVTVTLGKGHTPSGRRPSRSSGRRPPCRRFRISGMHYPFTFD